MLTPDLLSQIQQRKLNNKNNFLFCCKILQSSNTRKKKKVQVLPYQPDSQHQQNTIISTTKQGTLWTLNPGMWKDELSSLCQKYLDQIPLLLIASGVMLLAAAAKAEIDL